MKSEPSSGIKLTAYSCICSLFHRIYYDAHNHKHQILLVVFVLAVFNVVMDVTLSPAASKEQRLTMSLIGC